MQKPVVRSKTIIIYTGSSVFLKKKKIVTLLNILYICICILYVNINNIELFVVKQLEIIQEFLKDK